MQVYVDNLKQFIGDDRLKVA